MLSVTLGKRIWKPECIGKRHKKIRKDEKEKKKGKRKRRREGGGREGGG